MQLTIINKIASSNIASHMCMYLVQSKTMLTLSWRRPLSYRNQSIDLLAKSMEWFPYDNGVRHERVKRQNTFSFDLTVKFSLFKTFFNEEWYEKDAESTVIDPLLGHVGSNP